MLRVEDIDSKAGVIHVRQAKRNRARDVMLGLQEHHDHELHHPGRALIAVPAWLKD